ncbi:hypothetical protein DFS33DRAFT_1322689 [Desarmillaria ectypa]|nr:hypothetical protein DFS33DRAFT_1322689 [Desarmillaria ectypa]
MSTEYPINAKVIWLSILKCILIVWALLLAEQMIEAQELLKIMVCHIYVCCQSGLKSHWFHSKHMNDFGAYYLNRGFA